MPESRFLFVPHQINECGKVEDPVAIREEHAGGEGGERERKSEKERREEAGWRERL